MKWRKDDKKPVIYCHLKVTFSNENQVKNVRNMKLECKLFFL